MSRNYANYSQYLGAQRCCSLQGQGPIGPLFLKVDKIDIKNKFKSNSIIEYNGAFKGTTTCIQ